MLKSFLAVFFTPFSAHNHDIHVAIGLHNHDIYVALLLISRIMSSIYLLTSQL